MRNKITKVSGGCGLLRPFFCLLCTLSLLASLCGVSIAQQDHAAMGDIGKKLANPLSELWSMSMNFELLKSYDGDVNKGRHKWGSDVILQPVMAIPLSGEGESEFRMITRPIIPIIFKQPVPRSYDNFYNKSGIGDIQLPFVFALPDKYAHIGPGNLILGAGPVFEFPTATQTELGSDQWSAGTATAVGYRTKKWTAVLFHNHFWKIAEAGQSSSKDDVNKGSLLYQFIYNLPKAWQLGTNPTITYNTKASSGNKWNVPVGFFVGKTTKVGKVPVNFKLGCEYSVKSEDDYGKQFVLRLQVTPVIQRLIQNPLFGK